MKSILTAISPTTEALLDPDTHFYAIRYYWQTKLLGELSNNTVIFGPDPETAIKSFLSKHRNVSRAELAEAPTAPR